MNLLVDLGNSAIKWAASDGGELVPGGRVVYSGQSLPAVLAPRWETMAKPAAVFVANVAGESAADQIEQYTSTRWGLAPQFVRTGARDDCGLTNAYRQPQQMGVDRWLGMIALWSRYRQAGCVIGCGTAFTFDAVDGEGRHLGGLIAPGVGLMRSALDRHAAGIPPTQEGETPELLGRSTAECVRIGTLGAIVSLTGQAVERARARTGNDMRLLVTGGDAHLVVPLLGDGFEHAPDLVLEGLAKIVGRSP